MFNQEKTNENVAEDLIISESCLFVVLFVNIDVKKHEASNIKLTASSITVYEGCPRVMP